LRLSRQPAAAVRPRAAVEVSRAHHRRRPPRLLEPVRGAGRVRLREGRVRPDEDRPQRGARPRAEARGRLLRPAPDERPEVDAAARPGGRHRAGQAGLLERSVRRTLLAADGLDTRVDAQLDFIQTWLDEVAESPPPPPVSVDAATAQEPPDEEI